MTGASRGIGRAVAMAAAGRAARVGLLARSADALAVVRDDVERRGGRAVVAVADVADAAALERAVAAVRDELGPVDILVNNAGVGCWGPFVDLRRDDVSRVIAVNLTAVLDLTRLVLPEMIERGQGHIVNVGSVAGRLGVPFESIYSASKFGLAGFTEALAVELGPLGIGVSMVNPGPVATGFADDSGWPATRPRRPRAVPPERVAAAVLAAVEHGHLEQVVPRWLRLAHVVRSVVPAAYLAGVRRAVAPQLADFARRRT